MLASRGVAAGRGVAAAAQQGGCSGIGHRLLASLAAALQSTGVKIGPSSTTHHQTALPGSRSAPSTARSTTGAAFGSTAASGSGRRVPPASVRGFAHATAAAERDSRFSSLIDADVDHFRQILGADAVVTDAEKLRGYNRDWMEKYEGASQVALLPQTVQQVSQVLAHCSERRLAVVPQGGNSSLAGGAVPCFDEVVLSTAAMKAFHSFDEVSGVVVCEAGCTLQEVDDYVHRHGFMVPLDLGAKDSCHIGGNVATNAGGLRLLRYGSMRANVLGVEAVTATGCVLDLLSTCRKDNTGYDLKQLFISSEGTLGVLTVVALACPPLPAAVEALCVACPDWPAVLAAFYAARRHLGEALSAFEFFDEAALGLALDHVPGLQHPIPDQPGPFYVILEAASSDAASNARRLEAFLRTIRSGGGVLGGRGDEAERAAAAAHIWKVRKNLSEGLRLTGDRVFKYDLSLKPGEMYGLVEETRQRLADFPSCTVVGYGHLGDGNLHLNVAAPTDGDAVQAVLEPYVYEFTAERGGSISAEHGLGQMKNEYMGFSKPPAAIDMMRRIKGLFDPAGILNPYKLLP